MRDIQEEFLNLNNNELLSKELVLLECGREKTSPLKHIGPYLRDIYLIHYCADGKGYFVCDGKKNEITRGDIFLIKPGSVVEYYSDAQSPWTYLWVGFSGTAAIPLLNKTRFASKNILKKVSPDMLGHFYTLVDEYNEKGILNIKCMGCLYLILGEIETEGSVALAKERYVREAVKYIMYNIENPISIDAIAGSLRIAPTYFINIFTELMGVSPKKYLTDMRLMRAYDCVKQGKDINEVYKICGYKTREAFCKAFKKQYGKLPKEIVHEDYSGV